MDTTTSSQAIVGTIDGVGVLKTDFERYGKSQKPGTPNPPTRQVVLDSFFRRQVLIKEAKDRGLGNDPQVVWATEQAMIDRLMETESALKVRDEEITGEMVGEYRANRGSAASPGQPLRTGAIETPQEIHQRLRSELAARKFTRWMNEVQAHHRVEITSGR